MEGIPTHRNCHAGPKDFGYYWFPCGNIALYAWFQQLQHQKRLDSLPIVSTWGTLPTKGKPKVK